MNATPDVRAPMPRPAMRLAVATLAAVFATPALAAVATQFVAQNPGFVYRSGVQGFGYYPAPVPAAVVAPAAAPAPARPTVGPGNRNWTTGNRLNLHPPWLRSRR